MSDRTRFSGHILLVGFVYLLAIMTSGCATYAPRPIEEVPFLERAQMQGDDDVTVTVAVLSGEESQAVFGVSLYDSGIQPVWVKIENRDDEPYWFLQANLDPDYFSPHEAAYINRFTFSRSTNDRMMKDFREKGIDLSVEPGQTVSGFVFTNLDQGGKEVNVDLVRFGVFKRFSFILTVPGLKFDYEEVDFDKLFSEEEIIPVNEKELRAALEDMPCCGTTRSGKGDQDPLNFVLIGNRDQVYSALIRSDWDDTEIIRPGAIWQTTKSYFLGAKYRYGPISPVYLFGRPQDAGFQKTRETARERNHLRLWLTPLRFREKPVWIGQISRDIGLQWDFRVIVGHAIDADVDEARNYLLMDLLRSQGIAKLGWVKGVGASSDSQPHVMAGGDVFWTDGLRAVLLLSENPVSYTDVQSFEWEIPPSKHPRY